MSFLKKNPLFCVVVVLCVAASIAGAFLAVTTSGKVEQAQRDLSGIEAQLSSLLNEDPAPTAANLDAAESNLEELTDALARIRDELQPGSGLKTSEDGVSVMTGIQEYISTFQDKVEAREDEAGEPAPISTPEDFAFGFEQYLDEASMLEDPEKVATLDKQRQILSYLLDQLIMTGPQSIEAVRRETLEDNEPNQSSAFSIDPAVSARVPGAINTMAFSLTFTGYTDALRNFLNRLARFELPIVVRSIEVARPSGSQGVEVPEEPRETAGAFDFFAGETPDDGEGAPSAEAPKPVFEENVSQFTIIVEFIEVVLPDRQNQEVSDPA